jgi:hypothetical protein
MITIQWQRFQNTQIHKYCPIRLRIPQQKMAIIPWHRSETHIDKYCPIQMKIP